MAEALLFVSPRTGTPFLLVELRRLTISDTQETKNSLWNSSAKLLIAVISFRGVTGWQIAAKEDSDNLLKAAPCIYL